METQLHLIVVWFHWKLRTKREGNCSGRSRVRRILLSCIQLLLLQFLHIIWSMPTNFALFKKPLDKFFINLKIARSSINIPCKFQEHWKQGRLLNRASNITNFPQDFEFTSERPHYSLALFSSFTYLRPYLTAFLSYSVFDGLHYLKKPWKNLETFQSSLPSLSLVDIHSTLPICLFCTGCPKERQRKENLQYEDRLSYAQRFAFSLMYSNTQFRTTHRLNLGLKQ